MAQLNQVIAIEKGIKSKTHASIDALYKAIQKKDAFDGLSRSYAKRDVEGEDLPSEMKVVQLKTVTVLETVKDELTELFDVTAQKEWANQSARADVEVDGTVLVKDCPVTYLLFLEKQLTDLWTLVSKLPTLDPAHEWTYDATRAVYAATPVTTARTKKTAKPIVLFPATDKHPAQTQLITEDVHVGDWTTVKYSGAMTEQDQRVMLRRIEKLQQSVKFARERANTCQAERRRVGDVVLGWLLQA